MPAALSLKKVKNYAKNYAGTIDSSLIWTQGLSSPYETLISTPKGLSPLLREMIRLYFLLLPSFTNRLINLVFIIHVLFLCFPQVPCDSAQTPVYAQVSSACSYSYTHPYTPVEKNNGKEHEYVNQIKTGDYENTYMPLTNLNMSAEDSRAYASLLPFKEEENNVQGVGEYTFLCFYKNLFHQEVQND